MKGFLDDVVTGVFTARFFFTLFFCVRKLGWSTFIGFFTGVFIFAGVFIFTGVFTGFGILLVFAIESPSARFGILGG